MIFPEMMELRARKTYEPLLLILGAEIHGSKVSAQGFITLGDKLRKGRRFWWQHWKLELTESLPAKTAAIVPVNLEIPIELEIIEWPEKTKSSRA